MKLLSNIDFGNIATGVNVPTPTAPDHIVNLAYLNTVIAGLKDNGSARVATQGNINLASPGSSVDGITMALNDVVLVRAQTDGSENGLYFWNGSAVAMTRTANADSAVELEQAVVGTEEGTSANVTYRQTSVNFTLGSGAVTWQVFGWSASPASETVAGVLELATQAETNGALDDTRAITAAKLGAFTGFVRPYVAVIGDGSANTFTITHNFGTRAVTAQLWRTATPYDRVEADMEATTVNTLTVKGFVTAPTTNQYTVVVRG